MSDDDNTFDLTRRKALAGLGTIGAASAGAGLGTSAYFNDTESFTGNSVEAGELDLFVHYTFAADQGQADGNLGDQTSGTVQGDTDGSASVSYDLSDVKPGDSGSLEFCFSIVDNPAYLWAFGSLEGDADNSVNEPEGATPWERDGTDSGELATYTRASLYYTGETSDSNNNDVLITEGTLRGVLKDLEYGLPLSGTGNPMDGVINRGAFDGGDSSDPQEGTDGTCFRLDWEVPDWIGNEVQSDSVNFDLSFYAEQARHNDGSGDWVVVQPNDDLGSVISSASPGDTLLLAAGEHAGAVTVDKAVNIRGEGPSNTTYDAGGASTGMNVQVGGIRIGNLTATNAGQAIDVNGSSGSRLSGVMLSNIVATGNTDRALVIDYTDNALVRDVDASNNGNDGLTFWYTYESHAENVVAHDNGDNGIYFNGDNNILLDAVTKRNADEGIDVNWYDDLSSDQQRVTLDNVVAMDNTEEDIEFHDNNADGTDDSTPEDTAADDSKLIRKAETGGGSAGLRLGNVHRSEVRIDQSNFPNGIVEDGGTDADP